MAKRDLARLDKYLEKVRESLLNNGKSEEETEAFVEKIIEFIKEKGGLAIKLNDGKQYLLRRGQLIQFLVNVWG